MITTKTFYPDAYPEQTSVNGWVYRRNLSGETWNQITTGNGTSAFNDSDILIRIDSYSTTDKWKYLYRSILVFDTSSIPTISTINSATISLYGKDNLDMVGWLPDINIYTITGTPTTSLSASDYQTFTSTACSTAISYNNFSITGYNNFVLNSNGLAEINKGGLSRFGVRNANYDAAGTPPTWAGTKHAYLTAYSSGGGFAYKPKLTVKYEVINTTQPGKDLSSLEALRNVELSCMGRFYIDESGNAVYENRNSRNA